MKVHLEGLLRSSVGIACLTSLRFLSQPKRVWPTLQEVPSEHSRRTDLRYHARTLLKNKRVDSVHTPAASSPARPAPGKPPPPPAPPPVTRCARSRSATGSRRRA